MIYSNATSKPYSGFPSNSTVTKDSKILIILKKLIENILSSYL